MSLFGEGNTIPAIAMETRIAAARAEERKRLEGLVKRRLERAKRTILSYVVGCPGADEERCLKAEAEERVCNAILADFAKAEKE